MIHGDLHGVIAAVDGRIGKTVALAAQYQRQFFLGYQPGIVDGKGIVLQRQGGGAKNEKQTSPRSITVFNSFCWLSFLPLNYHIPLL